MMLNTQTQKRFERSENLRIKFQNLEPAFHSTKKNGHVLIGERERAIAEKLSAAYHLSNNVLNLLPDDEFLRLLPHLEPAQLAAGADLQSGEHARYVYFPETAVVSQIHVLTDGNAVEVAMIGKEGAAGLTKVVGCQDPNGSVETIISGRALKIKADVLRHEFAGGSSSLQSVFLNCFGSLMRQISQKVVCNAHHLTQERFCSWLLMLRDRVEGDELTLTQDQISHYLGVHRPSITYIAQSLRQQGSIFYARGRIAILNRKNLEQFACECYWDK